MIRLAALAMMAAALGACEHGRGYVAGDSAVAAVVQDEGQRQKVAAAAEAGATAEDAMARVETGPSPSVSSPPP